MEVLNQVIAMSVMYYRVTNQHMYNIWHSFIYFLHVKVQSIHNLTHIHIMCALYYCCHLFHFHLPLLLPLCNFSLSIDPCGHLKWSSELCWNELQSSPLLQTVQ